MCLTSLCGKHLTKELFHWQWTENIGKQADIQQFSINSSPQWKDYIKLLLVNYCVWMMFSQLQ